MAIYHIEINNTDQDKREPRKIEAQNIFKAAKIYWKTLGFKGSVVVKCETDTYTDLGGTFSYYRKLGPGKRRKVGPSVLIRL